MTQSCLFFSVINLIHLKRYKYISIKDKYNLWKLQFKMMRNLRRRKKPKTDDYRNAIKRIFEVHPNVDDYIITTKQSKRGIIEIYNRLIQRHPEFGGAFDVLLNGEMKNKVLIRYLNGHMKRKNHGEYTITVVYSRLVEVSVL